ncbi:zeta toxin family protein [Micromonospora chersina]|uniref:zeta toxin family protein n=1 Tax=Micromonospora chersina TaxID=47854 RepID=UPI0033AC270C
MERAALVHYESGRIADMVAGMAYRDRKNIIWDITMSSPKVLEDRLAELQDHGYAEAVAVFVDIPVETSVERALARYRAGVDAWHEGYGGRYVPPEIIRGQRGARGRTINRETFDEMRDRFDRWSVYNNSVSGRAPAAVRRRGEVGVGGGASPSPTTTVPRRPTRRPAACRRSPPWTVGGWPGAGRMRWPGWTIPRPSERRTAPCVGHPRKTGVRKPWSTGLWLGSAVRSGSQ